MPKFMEARLGGINGNRVDRYIATVRVPLQIAAEGSEGYLTYTKYSQRCIYIPRWQLGLRQFLAFGL